MNGSEENNKRIVKSAELETVCGITSRLPANVLPEFAFAGKSNVGKSSLINCMLERKSLARTSQTPGKTQTINYYLIDKTLYFVDLPGYGYAKVSQTLREKWSKMTQKYLSGSKVLKLAFLLIDIRHEPGAGDRSMYEWFTKSGLDVVVVATKLDKLSRNEAAKQLSLISKTLGIKSKSGIIPFSSKTRAGREELWKLIDSELDKQKTI